MQAQSVKTSHAPLIRNPEDERCFVRWSVAIPCQVRWSGQVINAWVDNLSLGGALVHRAVLAPSPGERVEVHFCTGSESPMRCVLQGRVVHSSWDLSRGEQAGFFGLEFETLGGRHYPRLVQLLRRFALGQARGSAAHRTALQPFQLPPAA